MKFETPPTQASSLAVENLSRPPSNERQEEMRKELRQTAELFDGHGHQWFLAGGLSLDLSREGFSRDHQDIDIATFADDMEDFFDYASEKGYAFFVPGSEEPVTREAYLSLLHERENFFLHKNDETKPGPNSFEVMFLRKNDKGEVILGDVAVPAPVYGEAFGSREEYALGIPRQPKDIVVFHKLMDGRQKDLEDIRKVVPTLSKEERARLDGYLEDMGVVFTVDGREARGVDALLDATSHFSRGDISEERSEKTLKDLRGVTDTVFLLVEKKLSPEALRRELQTAFGETTVTTRKKDLQEMFDFMSADPKPTSDALYEFIEQTFLASGALEALNIRELQKKQRWEVRTKRAQTDAGGSKLL